MVFSDEQTAALVVLATTMIRDDDHDGARDLLLITALGLSEHSQAGNSPDGAATLRLQRDLENSGRNLKRVRADTGETGNNKMKSKAAAPPSPQRHIEENREEHKKQTHEEVMDIAHGQQRRSAQSAGPGPAASSASAALEMRKVVLQERAQKTTLLGKSCEAAQEACRDGYGSKEEVKATYAAYSKALKESP